MNEKGEHLTPNTAHVTHIQCRTLHKTALGAMACAGMFWLFLVVTLTNIEVVHPRATLLSLAIAQTTAQTYSYQLRDVSTDANRAHELAAVIARRLNFFARLKP